jgi:tetratricopeptide (TPR) repeat protein
MAGEHDFRKLETALREELRRRAHAGGMMGKQRARVGSSIGMAGAGDNVVPHPALHDRPSQVYGVQAPLTRPRAFVVMPFGRKKDADGKEINFNAVYDELIAPSLAQAGFQPFRAGVEHRPGGILADMFQELLLADLVVADVTIDNPNAWYELGVRHALRPRGTIMIQGGRASIPFDVGPERVFPYRICDGRPDPHTLPEDRARIAGAAMATWHAERERKDSPVFSYLPSLEEPEWRRLRVGHLRAYWDRLDAWERRIDAATQRNQPGDILLLADEPPVQPLRLEALRTATRALVGLKSHKLAIKIAERALALDPEDIVVRQQKAIAHERLGQFIEARQILEALDQEDGEAAKRARGETRGILGRIAKSEWRASARANDGRWRDNAFTRGLLRQSLQAYASAFRAAPANYFPAINAVGLSHLYRHLTGQSPPAIDIEGLKHGLRWAISCARESVGDDRESRYWLRATESELFLLEGNLGAAQPAYAHAASGAVS